MATDPRVWQQLLDWNRNAASTDPGKYGWQEGYAWEPEVTAMFNEANPQAEAMRVAIQGQGAYRGQERDGEAEYEALRNAFLNDRGIRGEWAQGPDHMRLFRTVDKDGKVLSSGYREAHDAMNRGDYATVAALASMFVAPGLNTAFAGMGLTPGLAGAATGATLGGVTGGIGGGVQGALKGAALGGIGGYAKDALFPQFTPYELGDLTANSDLSGIYNTLDGAADATNALTPLGGGISSIGSIPAGLEALPSLGAGPSAVPIDYLSSAIPSGPLPQVPDLPWSPAPLPYEQTVEVSSGPDTTNYSNEGNTYKTLDPVTNSPVNSYAPTTATTGVDYGNEGNTYKTLDPTTNSPVNSLPPPSNGLLDWMKANPRLAIQMGGLLGGVLKGGVGGGGSGGIGQLNPQTGFTATQPQTMQRTFNAPPPGFRPGFDPEWRYLNAGVGALSPDPNQATTMPVTGNIG